MLSQFGRSLFDALVALDFSVKDSRCDAFAQQLEPALGKLAADVRSGFQHVAGRIHDGALTLRRRTSVWKKTSSNSKPAWTRCATRALHSPRRRFCALMPCNYTLSRLPGCCVPRGLKPAAQSGRHKNRRTITRRICAAHPRSLNLFHRNGVTEAANGPLPARRRLSLEWWRCAPFQAISARPCGYSCGSFPRSESIECSRRQCTLQAHFIQPGDQQVPPLAILLANASDLGPWRLQRMDHCVLHRRGDSVGGVRTILRSALIKGS